MATRERPKWLTGLNILAAKHGPLPIPEEQDRVNGHHEVDATGLHTALPSGRRCLVLVAAFNVNVKVVSDRYTSVVRGTKATPAPEEYRQKLAEQLAATERRGGVLVRIERLTETTPWNIPLVGTAIAVVRLLVNGDVKVEQFDPTISGIEGMIPNRHKYVVSA